MAKPQRRRGRAPDRPASQPSTADLISELAPDASPEARTALGQLRFREPEIRRWLEEDPTRLDGLEQDPENTVEELLAAIGVKWPGGVKLQENPDLEVRFQRPKETAQPAAGSGLLSAIWSFMSHSKANATLFEDDPLEVAKQVAKETGASKAERDAVIRAFEIILGIQRLEVDPFASLEGLAQAGSAKPVTVTRLTTG